MLNKIFKPKTPKKKILVVDDDEHTLKLISHYLTPLELETHTHTNYNDATEALQKHPFRLAIIDIALQGKNGLSILNKIRKTPKISKTPVIIISGAVPTQRLQALPNDFPRTRTLQKPISMKTLQALTEEALKTGFA